MRTLKGKHRVLYDGKALEIYEPEGEMLWNREFDVVRLLIHSQLLL